MYSRAVAITLSAPPAPGGHSVAVRCSLRSLAAVSADRSRTVAIRNICARRTTMYPASQSRTKYSMVQWLWDGKAKISKFHLIIICCGNCKTSKFRPLPLLLSSPTPPNCQALTTLKPTTMGYLIKFNFVY